MAAYRRKKASGARRIWMILAAFLLLAVGIYSFWDARRDRRASTGEAAVHFLDVGQGDGAMIVTDGGFVMVDAGPNASAETTLAYVRRYTDTLEYLILTHPHEDHISGADEILNGLTVKHVVMTEVVSATSTYTRLLDALEHSGAEVTAAKPGMEFSVGTSLWKILGPTDETLDMNNTSVVVRLTAGGCRVLFTGDAETEEENALLECWPESEFRADVLKVGHHGSSSSSGTAFLQAVNPSVAVISCGQGNDYGHPHAETLVHLSDAGVSVWRTDRSGTVTAHLKAGQVTMEGST